MHGCALACACLWSILGLQAPERWSHMLSALRHFGTGASTHLLAAQRCSRESPAKMTVAACAIILTCAQTGKGPAPSPQWRRTPNHAHAIIPTRAQAGKGPAPHLAHGLVVHLVRAVEHVALHAQRARQVLDGFRLAGASGTAGTHKHTARMCVCVREQVPVCTFVHACAGVGMHGCTRAGRSLLSFGKRKSRGGGASHRRPCAACCEAHPS